MKSIALLFLSVALCGCSTFNRDWRRMSDHTAPANQLEGRWDGRWLSKHNGHKGRLRAIIAEKGDGVYEARYRASYAKIFRFEYTAELIAEENGARFDFSGSADLGKLAGGIYEYEGQVETNTFFSTYTSQYDHGTFEMSRPEK